MRTGLLIFDYQFRQFYDKEKEKVFAYLKALTSTLNTSFSNTK